MKKILTLIIAALAVNTASAQTKEVIENPNELQLSIGFGSVSDILGGIGLALSGVSVENNPTYEMGDNYHRVPAINFSYGRQLTPLVNLSIIASYSQISRETLLHNTQTKVGYKMFGSAAIIPSVRFDWYHKRYFRCYSKVGLGMSNYLDRGINNDDPSKNYNNDQWAPCFDIVPWGFAIGGKLYGFGEISLGTIGTVKAGIGYRF